jgi:hypothetical protein
MQPDQLIVPVERRKEFLAGSEFDSRLGSRPCTDTYAILTPEEQPGSVCGMRSLFCGPR